MTRDRLLRVLRPVIAALVLVMVVFAVARNWSNVRPHLGDLSVGWTGLALVSVMVAQHATMMSWRAVLADLGSPLPVRPAVRMFYLGQLGKYIPGSVWTVVAHMELGREYAVPRRRSATAGLVAIALSLMAAALVAAVCVPFIDDVPGYAWLVLLLLPIGAVVLHPPIFSAIVNTALRVVKRDPLEHALSRGGELRAFGWALAAWIGFGTQAWAIARDLGATEPGVLPVAIGGFALAWTVGFLVIFMPAGVGPREAVLVAVFAGSLPGGKFGGALALALISRLLMSLGDVIWAAIAVAVNRGRRSSA